MARRLQKPTVDRVYIERFLTSRAADIRGDVLEVGSATWATQLGGDRVKSVEILDYSTANRDATIIGDLANAGSLPRGRFDCFIAPQTLQFTFDIMEAVRTMERMLRPGGVALATFPAIAPIAREHMDREGDFWRITSRAARRLFAAHFPPRRLAVSAYGNLKAALACLQGQPADSLPPAQLRRDDPNFEVIVAVRAVKAP
jgi:SAM-dependent methyltransferase